MTVRSRAALLGAAFLLFGAAVGHALAGAQRAAPANAGAAVLANPAGLAGGDCAIELRIRASGASWRRMLATAYTAGPESTGKAPGDPGYGITATGLPARPGVAAVDPKVIPLGSVLWVEGYGLAVALDTGSAIRGNRIDRYMPGLKDAFAWGAWRVWVAQLNQTAVSLVSWGCREDLPAAASGSPELQGGT